jgi:hypothetical protein
MAAYNARKLNRKMRQIEKDDTVKTKTDNYI